MPERKTVLFCSIIFILINFLVIALMAIQLLLLSYGTTKYNSITSDYYTRYIIANSSKHYQKRINQLESDLKDATKSAYLRDYLRSNLANLAPYHRDIYDSATYFGLEPSLMVAIAVRESSGCVHYIRSTNNCLGYDGGYRSFRSIPEAFWHVSEVISTSKTYASFQKDKTNVRSLAYVYNGGDREGWFRGVSDVMERIRNFKTKYVYAKI